jgi:hypothetical protein
MKGSGVRVETRQVLCRPPRRWMLGSTDGGAMSRTPSHGGLGLGARLVDVRDTRWNPVAEAEPTRPCTWSGCPGVMRPRGLHVPPVRGRGPARRYVPDRARTLIVWTCAVCGRQAG